MYLCCCGNIKNLKSSSHCTQEQQHQEQHQEQEQEQLKNHNDKTKKMSIESTESNNSIPIVKMRNDTTTGTTTTTTTKRQQQLIFSEPLHEINTNDDDDNNKTVQNKFINRNISQNSLVKSVIHKNIRFDETSLNRKVRGGSLHVSRSVAAQHAERCDDHFSNTTPSRRGSLYIFRAAEDAIVTPFAQILSSLRKILANFKTIADNYTNMTIEDKDQVSAASIDTPSLQTPDVNHKIATDTVKELEWCLERLESIQTGRSVSDMASIKFKQIINNELSSNLSHQVSDYIKTFLESTVEEAPSTRISISNEQSSVTFSTQEGEENSNMVKVRTAPSLLRHTSSGSYKGSRASTTASKSQVIFEEKGDEENEEIANGQETDVQLQYGIHLTNEEKVKNLLESELLTWGLDIFQLHELSDNHSLLVVSYEIFEQHNFFDKFEIEPQILIEFLKTIEGTYRDNPYHNSIHAADVTQSANMLMEFESLKGSFTDLELFAVILACIIHDADHPGVSNQFLVNTGHELATLYNDISVLENHHLATGFKIMGKPESNILHNLAKAERISLRKMIIDMVLATDLAKHVSLLADLKTMLEMNSVSRSGELSLNSYEDRILILKSLVHCSDISNPTKDLKLYEKWVRRITDEFFVQGDKEKELNIEISPLCDKLTATIPASQVSFIRYVVHPFWETFIELVNDESIHFVDILTRNLEYYDKEATKEKGAKSQNETTDETS